MSTLDYPHPVLQPEGYDYKEGCSFDIVLDEDGITSDGTDIILKVGYSLECDGLRDMIASGDASACVIAHSPAGSYRRLHNFAPDSNEVEVKVNKFEAIEKIEVQCLILAARDSSRFRLDDFNQVFFEGATFTIRRGAILATSVKISIPLDDSELQRLVSSIFTLNSVPDLDTPIQPNFASETGKITIDMRPELFQLYYEIEAGYAKAFLRCLTGAIVLPVLVEAIEKLHAQHSEYEDYPWARSIESKLEKRGIDVVDFDGSSVRLANELLGNVVADSLGNFKTVVDSVSDTDDNMGGVD